MNKQKKEMKTPEYFSNAKYCKKYEQMRKAFIDHLRIRARMAILEYKIAKRKY